MKQLLKFWFTPKLQRPGKPVVEFECMPLDHRTYLFIQGEISVRGTRTRISPDGIIELFENNVTNWRGLEPEFSREAKTAIIDGPADAFWAGWQVQIAGELYRRVLLGEPEAKNS